MSETSASVAPRYPVPGHVSEEAQGILGLPIDLSFESRPSPGSTEEWEAQIRESDAVFAPMVLEKIESAPVTIELMEVDGVTIRLVEPEDKSLLREGSIILNFHGGGFTMFGGDISVFEALPLAEVGYRVVCVDYRMLPHHPYPAAVDDCMTVYRSLLENYDASSIALVGTSAGGNLVAAVTLMARDAGLPLPAAAVMHTPWSDLGKIGDSYFTNDRVDPMLTSYDVVGGAARLYADGKELNDPLLSPVYGDYTKGFPPSLLSTGTRDLLLSCTLRLHRVLRSAKMEAELHVFDALWHGFGLTLPEEGKALNDEVLAFLDKHLLVQA